VGASPPSREPEGEDGEAGDERAPSAEHVAEAAAEQQQPTERERVGVEHPGERRRREAEVGSDIGQGDVHDGHVENQHQLHREDQGQAHRRATAGTVNLLGHGVFLVLDVD
jgi:hypothetical protein